MKFTNSPFAILEKNMSTLDYQKRYLVYEDYWKKEETSILPHKEFEEEV